MLLALENNKREYLIMTQEQGNFSKAKRTKSIKEKINLHNYS